MEDQLVTKETAILAKEKGFDEVTDVFFNSSYPWPGEENINALRHSDGNDFTSVPTQSLLQKWLREVHNIYVEVNITFLTKAFDVVVITNEMDGVNHQLSILNDEHVQYDNYEQALEEGLIGALNRIP